MNRHVRRRAPSRRSARGAAAAVLLVAIAAGARDARATTMLRMDVAELAVGSEVVLVGRVEAVRSEWNSKRTGIHTLSTVRVLEVIDATPGTPGAAVAAGGVVEVWTRGGMVGDVGMTVMGAPEMRAGEEAVLFLDRVGPRLGVTGWALGKWGLAPAAPGTAAPAADPLGARLCAPFTGGLSLVERGPDGALRPAAPPRPRKLADLRAEIRAARGAP